MPEKPVLVASDVHLGAISQDQERAFLRWLHHAGEAASEVILNGDLFDFWYEYGSVIPRGYTRVLGALAGLVDGGTAVTVMGGNHDWWGGAYFRDELGVEFLASPVVRDLAGLQAFVAHGDGLGRGDLGYRLLRVVLRSRMTRWAFRWLHPDVGAWIAKRVSQTEDRWGESGEEEEARSRFLEDWAVAKLGTKPDLDLVLLGHTHVPVLRAVDRRRWYVNSGDWVHHRSYVVLSEAQAPELREFRG